MRSSFAHAKLLAPVAILAIALSPVGPATARTGHTSASIDDARHATLNVSGELCSVTHPIATAPAPPFGVGPCPGVRPGAQLWTDVGGCTFNFYWKGYVLDDLGNLVEAGNFMGTAGHCALATQAEEESVWAPGEGPVVEDGTNTRIGEFAYAVNSPTKDFSLVRLDPGVAANPQMCHFGGPNGIHDPSFSPLAPRVIQHFGQGLVLGDTVSARSGVAYNSDPNWSFGVDEAIFGDSGSGVETDDGRAFGVLVAISPLGIIYTRIPPRLEDARKALGLESFELQTAPEL
jgi:hypothetical protein